MVTEGRVRTGQVVAGRYLLEDQIGAGGTGVVWRAVGHELGRVVAVKRAARPADADSERTQRRMRREARIAARLHHPHVVEFIEEVIEGHRAVARHGICAAKLTDFGISRPIYGDVTMTNSGLVGGTVAFLASEVADGQAPTPASDVFALGATLFATVEGIPPFGTADNPLLVLRRAAAGDLLPVHRAGPRTPILSALL